MSFVINPYRFATGFNPSQLTSVIAWWDASDASTFTYSSGTVVSGWASKVGSYTLGNATSGNQPSRSATVNGLGAVDFSTSKSLNVASFDMTGGQKFSVWAVFSAPSGSDRIVVEHSANINSNNGAWMIFRASDNNASVWKFASSRYANFVTGTLTTTAKVIVATHDGTLSTNETVAWLNGSGTGTRSYNENTSGDNRNDTLYVGARGGSSLYFNGTLCELGVTTAVMTTTERQSLEAYLSAKWGLGF